MEQRAVLADLAVTAPREADETDEEYEMFQYFVSLPPSKREARAVAARFGIAQRRVADLALRRDWVRRAKEHDLAVIAALRTQLAQELAAFVAQLVQLGGKVVEVLSERLTAMEFSPGHVDRIISALASLASAVSSLVPQGGGQQPASNYAMVQNLILMHLQNATAAVHSSVTDGLPPVVDRPGQLD